MEISDNRGNIIAPMVIRPVSVHDNLLFDQSFTNLLDIIDLLQLDITFHPFLTLDSGFDDQNNKNQILHHGFIPVIKPNLRGLKKQEKINQKLDDFAPLKPIHKERYNIERCFAWEDKYRKLVIRYEKLQCTFMGFRFLAYSMINFRWIFGKK